VRAEVPDECFIYMTQDGAYLMYVREGLWRLGAKLIDSDAQLLAPARGLA
jgi:hypothetical protein